MKWLAALVGVVLVAGAAWVVYALIDDEEIGSQAEAILEEPGDFVGDQVTVRGEVESFFPGAFTIGDSTWGEEMLIVARGRVAIPETIESRAGRPDVRVTGVVRMKDDSTEILGGEQFEPFEGEPYIDAARIEIVEA